MAVTSYTIAEVCGLSQPTVSRILANGDNRHSQATRQLVTETARRMGYRPNAAARVTRTGKTSAIALLLGTKDGRSSLPADLLNGIQDALRQHDLNLMVVRMDDEHLADGRYVPRILREVASDGLLIDYTHDIPESMIRLIAEHRIPAVWINSPQPHDCVRPDDFGAGKVAAEHLIKLGHGRIAWADFTHGPDFVNPHYSAADRHDGYATAMIDADLKPLVIRASQGVDVPSPQRIAFADSVLAGEVCGERPTAVIAYSQTTAIPFHVAAVQRGLSVPGDLALISFDDHPVAFMGPEYANFAVPNHRIGREAVSMLIKLLDQRRAQSALALPFAFSPGHTTPSLSV